MTNRRIAELCLGTCGGCEHCDLFEQLCTKHRKTVSASDPACNDYRKWKMKKRGEREGHEVLQ